MPIDGVIGDGVFLDTAAADVVDDEGAALFAFLITDNHDVRDVARQHVADDVPGLGVGYDGSVALGAVV